jgi:predicted ATPase
MLRNFIITGTSGVGKTTLIKCLENQGYPIVPEPIRIVLQEQVNQEGLALPSKNPSLFLQELFQLCIRQLQATSKHKGVVFFDRGLPDLLAYARRFKVDPLPFELTRYLPHYQPKVFILEPWEDIFVSDEFRGGSFKMYQDFHQLLVSAYTHCKFELVVVPFDSIENRAQFILDHI